MKEKVVYQIGNKLDSLNVFVDDAYFSLDNNLKTLNIILDSQEIIDVDKVVLATKIINPIIDDMAMDFDVLDIYSKEKGDVK